MTIKEKAELQKKKVLNGGGDGRSPAEIKFDSEQRQKEFWVKQRESARIERSPVIKALVTKLNKTLESYDWDNIKSDDVLAIHNAYKSNLRQFEDSIYGVE